MASDNEIMLDVKNGDVDRLGILFDRYHKHLFNYFLSGTQRRDASDDLVQEVFLRMLKYRGSFKDDGVFKVWMFSIAANARKDYYRKHSVRHEAIENAGDIVDLGPSPEDNVMLDDDIESLKKALKLLPHDMREVIVLSRYQNMRYKEIGEVVGCSEGAVKVRVHRAMKELTGIYHTLTGQSS